MSNILDAKIQNISLFNKFDISGYINNTDLNEKIKTSATKTELKTEQYKIEKLQTDDSSLFIGQVYFINDV